MKATEKSWFSRLSKRCRTGCVVAGIGVIYYLLILFTPIRIPCVFRELTGLACPGCGISRGMVALLHLDFSAAFRQNVVVFSLLPFWCAAVFLRVFFDPRWMQKDSTVEKVFLFGTIAALLIFGIFRNLPGVEVLLPSS